jgi:hypothetical protein
LLLLLARSALTCSAPARRRASSRASTTAGIDVSGISVVLGALDGGVTITRANVGAIREALVRRIVGEEGVAGLANLRGVFSDVEATPKGARLTVYMRGVLGVVPRESTTVPLRSRVSRRLS